MEISRDLAIQILKYCAEHKDFCFPFLVVYDDVEIESSKIRHPRTKSFSGKMIKSPYYEK